MTNGIESKPTGLHRIFRRKSNPESKTHRRLIKPKTLLKAGGLVLGTALVAGIGTKELVTEPRKEALMKAEQTQIDFYDQAKVGGKLLPLTGTMMFIKPSANIRENSATFDGGTLIKPNNVIDQVKEGQELVIFNGIARDYGFKWTEFGLQKDSWEFTPNNATEFAYSMVAVRHQELAAQGLVTVCDMPGRGRHAATIGPNWVLEGVGDSDAQVAVGTIMEAYQSATVKAAFGDACKKLK